MQEFPLLSRDKLDLIYHELNEFFYKRASINIAIENAVEKKQYRDFENKTNKALKRQLGVFAKKSTISNILTKINKIDDAVLMSAIASYFLAFSDSFSTGEKGVLLYLIWAANLGGTDALAKMGLKNISFYPNSSESKSIINQRLTFFTQQIDQTSQEWVSRIIKTGIKDDLDPGTIAKMVEDKLDEIVTYRASIIAETELVTMFSIFQNEVYKQNGITNKKWTTVNDEKTCPICQANEDQGTIPVGDTFNSGVLTPPAHILCRCYIMPDGKRSGEVWRG